MTRVVTLMCCSAAILMATVVAPASASEIIDRNATTITLQVNTAGEARVSYRAQAKQISVLAWGAKNAVAPTTTHVQTNFKLDYTGGYQTHYLENPVVKTALGTLRMLQEEMTAATAAGNNKLRYALKPKIAAVYVTLARLRTASTSFRNACRPYTGPTIPWLVVACTAPDGSYWALQSWQRALPDLGLAP